MDIHRKFRVLIPDNWHFHRRNFASLFDYMKEDGVYYHVVRKRTDWCKLHGDYAAHRAELARHLEVLTPMTMAQLRDYAHQGIPLFAAARAEILSLVLALPDWQDKPLVSEDDALFAELYQRARDILLLNMAAAMDWVEFWNDELNKFKPFTHCCIFSGSYIYTRTLLNVCRQRGTRTLVMEGFFTGNEFYCEERSTPIANASDLGLKNYDASIRIPDDIGEQDRMRAQAHRALANMNNKNVKKQKDVPLRYFDNGKPTLLIIGQVLNDFSIIETASHSVATIPFYKSMMQSVLEKTDMNIIFKAHPWEHHRPNVRAARTLQEMQAFAAQVSDAQRGRIQIVETPPLTSLLNISDWAVTICSQGALEACNMGFKAVQFGNAFYGAKGFTHDYPATAIDGFLDDVKQGAIANQLTLDEFRCFENFLVRALVRHLITNDYMGVRKLRLIFNAAHGALAVGTIPSVELSAFQAFQLRKRHALATTWHALKNSPYAVLRNFIRAWLKVVKRNTGVG